MKKEIQRIYFRLYKYYDNGRSIPLVSIFCVIFAIMVFMAFGLFNVLKIFFGKELFTFPVAKAGTIMYLWPLLLFFPLYFIFKYLMQKEGLHDSIMNEFENESEKDRRKSIFMTLCVVIFPLVFFFLTLYLRG